MKLFRDCRKENDDEKSTAFGNGDSSDCDR